MDTGRGAKDGQGDDDQGRQRRRTHDRGRRQGVVEANKASDGAGPSDAFVFFGVSGDLAHKLVFPPCMRW
jgi:hypothetical protein